MKARIIKVITSTLKAIKADATIYLDSVMQSSKPFYLVLSVDEGGTDNVGLNVQNKVYLVDVAFIDNKETTESKQMIEDLIAQCGSFFNVLNIDGNQVFPDNYLAYESDGVPHISFNVAFPQKIEWSEI
ncbi:phage tail terminator family protein [Enterococcus sp. AZ194]|uniref:phage tail terminator family protein n=1 Tax=Enterococcus sp. AZ194 TaxID=2774629 RepID=UPI003F68807D